VKQIRKNELYTLITIMSILIIISINFNTVSPAPATRVYIYPKYVEGQIGKTFTVDVKIDDVIDIYAFEFKLLYDTSILDATNIAVTPFLNEPTYTVKKQIDDTSGLVWYGVSSLPPAFPKSDSGTLATITFQVIGEGECALDLYYLVLAHYPDSNEIPAEVTDGLFICGGTTTLTTSTTTTSTTTFPTTTVTTTPPEETTTTTTTPLECNPDHTGTDGRCIETCGADSECNGKTPGESWCNGGSYKNVKNRCDLNCKFSQICDPDCPEYTGSTECNYLKPGSGCCDQCWWVDPNYDNFIGIADLRLMSKAYGCELGDACYKSEYDFHRLYGSVIDIFDFVIIARNIGSWC